MLCGIDSEKQMLFTTEYKDRAELEAVLKESFDICDDTRNLDSFWKNLSTMLLACHDKANVEQVYYFLVVATIIQVYPQFLNGVPKWLPKPIRDKMINERLQHPRDEFFKHISADDSVWFFAMHQLFSVFIDIAVSDEMFLKEFVAYTEIQLPKWEEEALV